MTASFADEQRAVESVAEKICGAEYEGDPDLAPFPRTVRERHRRMAQAALAAFRGGL